MVSGEREEERCDCGKLLFKRTKRGFEFKCNRCKRIHLIPFDWFAEEYRSLCPIVKSESDDEDSDSQAAKPEKG